MNWTRIKDIAYTLVGDTEAAGAYFPLASMREWANQAVRDMAQRSGCLQWRQPIVVTAGTAEYALPADCAQVFRVTYDGEVIWPVSQRRLRAYDARWRERTGTPYLYYLDELNAKIGLYPNPSTGTTYESVSGPTAGMIVDTGAGTTVEGPSVGVILDIADGSPIEPLVGAIYDVISGNSLEVFYYARPAAVNDGAIQIPGWAHPGIVYGMVSRAFAADTPRRNLGAAAIYRNLYEDVVRRLTARSNGKLHKVWHMEGYAPTRRLGMTPRLPQHIEES